MATVFILKTQDYFPVTIPFTAASAVTAVITVITITYFILALEDNFPVTASCNCHKCHNCNTFNRFTPVINVTTFTTVKSVKNVTRYANL